MTDLPTGTVTFLFTDIEGSTRLWERHPQAMADALARHDTILRQATAAHAGVVFRTVLWVVVVVSVTLLLSLALAQLFHQRFPFRRVARTALIAPWAASVLMTALIFRWALDPNVGAINTSPPFRNVMPTPPTK